MKVCIEFVYIIVLRSEKRTAFEPKLIQILQTLQGYQNFAILLCSSWLGQNLVYNIQLLDEAEQSIEIRSIICGEQINYLPKQFTETNLGNSGRLDQIRVLLGFPISKEFDFTRFNELKF